MANMNPIKKNESYKYSWLNKPPVVPDDMALVLYPHDSREHCNVYLQEDTVYPEAIKKWHLDRLVHITLESFEFQHSFRFPLSNGINQWIDITYKFVVSVKPDKDAIKVILKNNVTDISEPILDNLDAFALDKSYSSLEILSLQADALQKIRALLSRIMYLKIQVSQIEYSVDDISKKQIEEEKKDRIREEEVKARQKELAREKEEAEVRRKEVEIEQENAERQKQLAKIRHQVELEQQQHEIDKKTKEVAAQKAYQIQQAENVAAIAQAQLENIKQFGLESLAAIDSNYQEHINIQQAKIDRERDNKIKDLELAKQTMSILLEAVKTGAMGDITAEQIIQQLLLGGAQSNTPQISTSSPVSSIEDKGVINLSEDGRDDI